jgi:hypothetical protein
MEDHQAEHYFRRVSNNRRKVSAEVQLTNQEAGFWWDVWDWGRVAPFHRFGVCQDCV